jgi:repressor LexA
MNHTCPNCSYVWQEFKQPLTVRQRQLVDFIGEYIVLNRFAPSFQEIAEAFGYHSLATVHEHLTNLQRKGWIRRNYNESRAIELVEDAA